MNAQILPNILKKVADFSPSLKKILIKNGCYLKRQGKGDHEMVAKKKGEVMYHDPFIPAVTEETSLLDDTLKRAFSRSVEIIMDIS